MGSPCNNIYGLIRARVYVIPVGSPEEILRNFQQIAAVDAPSYYFHFNFRHARGPYNNNKMVNQLYGIIRGETTRGEAVPTPKKCL